MSTTSYINGITDEEDVVDWEQEDRSRLNHVFQTIYEEVNRMAPIYAQATGKNKHCKFNYPDRIEITDSGRTFTVVDEYNDSCHCHPNMRRVELNIPLEMVLDSLCGIDWAGPLISKRDAEEVDRHMKLIAEQERQHKLEEERKKDSELKLLAELKSKYGERV